MFIKQHEVQYPNLNKGQKIYLSRPKEIRVTRQLSGISSCSLVYSSYLDRLYSRGQDHYPFELRLFTKLENNKERFFCGLLNAVRIEGSFLILQYLDPLLKLKAKEDPIIWNGDKSPTLEDVVNDTLSGSLRAHFLNE